MSTRPSPREVEKKIGDALTALKAGRVLHALTKHLAGDLADLELDSVADLVGLVEIFLREIQDAGAVSCYAGGHPP